MTVVNTAVLSFWSSKVLFLSDLEVYVKHFCLTFKDLSNFNFNRGTLPGRRSGRHPSYGSNPYQTQRPHSSDYDQNYYDSMNRQYHISPEPELLHSEVDTARYFSSDLNNSTLSLNDHISSSQDVAASQDGNHTF